MLAHVPFGTRELPAVVLDPDVPAIPGRALKTVRAVLDPEPVITAAGIALARWMSDYYGCPLSEVVATMLPPGLSRRTVYHIARSPAAGDAATRLTATQRGVLEAVPPEGQGTAPLDQLTREGGKSAALAVSTLVKRGLLVRTATLRRAGPKTIRTVAWTGRDPVGCRVGSKGRAVLSVLQRADGPLSVAELGRHVTGAVGALPPLQRQGLVTIGEEAVRRDPVAHRRLDRTAPLTLRPAQDNALAAIVAALEAGARETFLLHGVTGSGKTEVYLQALAATIRLGRQAIVLVPEISLTSQTMDRFAARFPGRVALLHSGLSEGERVDEWERARVGAVDAVVGARSAIFSPLPNIGLIILDEEHDASYKQDRAPRYHTREVAIRLARETGAVVVLGSATPDVVTYYNATHGAYHLLEMTQRAWQPSQPSPPAPLPAAGEGSRYGLAVRGDLAVVAERDGHDYHYGANGAKDGAGNVAPPGSAGFQPAPVAGNGDGVPGVVGRRLSPVGNGTVDVSGTATGETRLVSSVDESRQSWEMQTVASSTRPRPASLALEKLSSSAAGTGVRGESHLPPSPAAGTGVRGESHLPPSPAAGRAGWAGGSAEPGDQSAWVGGEGLPGGLPPVEVVDLRQELQAGNRGVFSRSLQTAVREALARREQVILFLNRRGSATFVNCRDCGLVVRCHMCDLPYTYHSSTEELICHRCDARLPPPTICGRCASWRIRYFGLGTQRVEEEARRNFPGARLLRWDRDVIGGKHGHEHTLDRFARGDADIMVGTQMVAKGLDIPRVTVVGVISADTALNLPDFRAAERTFQMLTQVAGRAGRHSLPGRVVIQTYAPEHFSIGAASGHDYTEFYDQEIVFRREAGYPPFAQLLRLVYSDEDEAACRAAGEALAARLRAALTLAPHIHGEVVGPAPCFIGKIEGRYLWQVLVRADDVHPLLPLVPPGWTRDVDPVSLL